STSQHSPLTGSRTGWVPPGTRSIIVSFIPIRHPFRRVPRHMRDAKRALPTLFEPMPHTHAFETAGDRHQRDRFTHPHSSVIVRNIDERLHISPRKSTPVTPSRCLLPFSFRWKPFSCPSAIGGRRFPLHPNGRTISNRRRRLIIPCRGRLVCLCFQKLPIETESDFILIDGIGIKRHGMFRPLVWKSVITTHGEWTGRDINHGSPIPSSAGIGRRNRLGVLRRLWLRHPKAANPYDEADPHPQQRLLSLHHRLHCPRVLLYHADGLLIL